MTAGVILRGMSGMRLSIVTLLLMTACLLFADEEGGPVSRWAVIDGIRIHYLEAGGEPSAEPPLLMVHGWCGSSADFGPLMRALPAGTRSLAVDMPGCGLSDKPDAAYDLPYFMNFLCTFTEAFGLERFTLVGHSMGGQLSVHFASLWPGRVERLVLISPYGLKGEEGPWLPLAQSGCLVDAIFGLNNRLFIEWALAANNLYRPSPGVLSALADSTAEGILGRKEVRATARITRNLIGRDPVEGILPGVRAPTLILWGDHDALLAPRWAQQFVALLPDVRLRWILDAGHMATLEKPQEAAEAIAGFLTE
jgi:pimeloyl-ACP methyl ester carboxylesterase